MSADQIDDIMAGAKPRAPGDWRPAESRERRTPVVAARVRATSVVPPKNTDAGVQAASMASSAPILHVATGIAARDALRHGHSQCHARFLFRRWHGSSAAALRMSTRQWLRPLRWSRTVLRSSTSVASRRGRVRLRSTRSRRTAACDPDRGALVAIGTIVSVDTSKAAVARAALDAGAHLINDVRALTRSGRASSGSGFQMRRCA